MQAGLKIELPPLIAEIGFQLIHRVMRLLGRRSLSASKIALASGSDAQRCSPPRSSAQVGLDLVAIEDEKVVRLGYRRE